MATRNLLHINDLEDFKKWLIQDGWQLLTTSNNFYEMLRATKPGKKYPLIVYTKLEAKEHLSVADRDVSVIYAFLKDKKKNKSLEELGYKLYSESDSSMVYKYEDETFVISVHIYKEMKRVSISDSIWVPNNENWYQIKDNLPENVRFSSRYGYWQTMPHDCTIQELNAIIKILGGLENE